MLQAQGVGMCVVVVVVVVGGWGHPSDKASTNCFHLKLEGLRNPQQI